MTKFDHGLQVALCTYGEKQHLLRSIPFGLHCGLSASKDIQDLSTD